MTRDRAFAAVMGLLFIALAAATVMVCAPMRGGMRMPGGWTMSMAWMRMPGQSRTAAWLMFMAMWSLMMSAMMLPCLGIFLARYRTALMERRTSRTVVAGAAYLAVWIVAGAFVYPIGMAIANAEMRSAPLARAVPLATIAVLVTAGAVQLTAWKSRQLVRCCDLSGTQDSAWLYGTRLGVRCAACCATFMIALMVTGMMSMAGMAIATVAITLERALPKPVVAARVFGILMIVFALLSFPAP